MVGEWGYHTTTSVSDAEQKGVFQDVVDNVQTMSNIAGFSFWVHMASNTASIWTDSGGNIVAGGRASVAAIKDAFKGRVPVGAGTAVSSRVVSGARTAAGARVTV